MNEARAVWRVNIPELLGLLDAGLDDLGIDEEGGVYVGDGVNGSVYRFRSGGEPDTAFDVIRPAARNDEEPGLNLAVAADSSFSVADPANERVVRYDSLGRVTGEFSAPGLLNLCCVPGGDLYVLASDDDGERIDRYDIIGSRIETLCAPRRYRAHLDPDLVDIDADRNGCAYLSYGMPPYRLWRMTRIECAEDEAIEEQRECRSEIEMWSRSLDHPEDAVLIGDIAFDPSGSVLWVLLALRESGRQILDAFSHTGEFLGSTALPHSDNLYSGICAGADGTVYLLDGAAGDLVRVALPDL